MDANTEQELARALKALAGTDLAAAESACLYLESALRSSVAHEVIDLVRKESLKHKSNSVVYMRFVELFCSILASGEEEFRLCESCGAARDVVELCTTDDVLVQMTAIELIHHIANTVRGLEFLCRENVITWLVVTSCGAMRTETVAAAEPDPLISHQALRVLGAVFLKAANKRFDMLHHMNAATVAHFLTRVRFYFEEGKEEDRLAGLAALSDFVCISSASLQMVVEDEQLMSAWMGLLVNSKAELMTAVLHGLAVVISQPDEKYVDNAAAGVGNLSVLTFAAEAKSSSEAQSSREHVASLKRQLLAKVGTAKRVDPIAYLMKLATQPVEGPRHAAVDLMRALAEQPTGWGLQRLFQYAVSPSLGDNFYAYLQERLTEYSKEGKDWKFALILAIANNPSRSHLPAEVNEKINLMVKQGAYYLPPMMDVKTMEG